MSDILISFAASSEDPSSTPKRKEPSMSMMGPMGGGYMGHGHSQGPVPPCSPSMNSMHDDYPPEGNQPWNRTPSSPVRVFVLWLPLARIL